LTGMRSNARRSIMAKHSPKKINPTGRPQCLRSPSAIQFPGPADRWKSATPATLTCRESVKKQYRCLIKVGSKFLVKPMPVSGHSGRSSKRQTVTEFRAFARHTTHIDPNQWVLRGPAVRFNSNRRPYGSRALTRAVGGGTAPTLAPQKPSVGAGLAPARA
jgi:hypothetical protein